MWIARNEDGGLILSIGKPYLPRTYYVGKLERRWLPTGNNKHVLTINRVVDDNLHEHYDKGMLPKVLDYGGIRNEQPLWLTSGKQWSVLFHGPINELDYESISDSLRDALFDMIKWLKTNKLI